MITDTQRNEIEELLKKEKDNPVSSAVNPVMDRNIQASDIVDILHKEAIVTTVSNDEEVKEKIINQGKKSIDSQLKTLHYENVAKEQKATYDANVEACKAFGIDSQVPTWQINMMKISHSVCFVLYWIFASITICPISVFFKGIKSFVKNVWLSVLFAILLYLIIAIGIPVIITLLKKGGLELWK